jgi:hypothetical protein
MVLQVGDRVLFDRQEFTVVGYAGTQVRLADPAGVAQVVLGHLPTSPGFALLDGSVQAARVEPLRLIEGLPQEVMAHAHTWERHVLEVLTGLPPNAPTGAAAREEYDPALRSLAQRDAAKAAELTAAHLALPANLRHPSPRP